MHGMPRGRRKSALAIRTIVILLVVLALAGLQSVRPNSGVSTVFVLDRSASMQTAQTVATEQFVSKALEGRGTNDSAGLIVLGKYPVIDTETGHLRSLGQIYASAEPSSTDIAAAIRLASATFPEGSAKRIVLLSDGNETTGDAAEAAQAAAAAGIEIDVVPPARAPGARNEVVVQTVDAPGEITKGQPFELHVVAQATGHASGTLHIDRDGAPVAAVPVSLSPGSNVLTVGQTVGAPGFYRYRATLDVDNDTDTRNNTGIAFANVRGRPRILLVEGKKGSGAALEGAIKLHDLDITRTGIEGLPTCPEQLQNYDSLILSDYPAQGLTNAQMTMIAAAVRDSGMGFGMVGGENSFLPGGYYETPIADVLPVDMNIRQRKVFPSTCIEIIVDASGSMGMMEDGVEKIKIAATAAASMVRMMSPNDLVGVAGSTDDIAFVAPIQKAIDKDGIAAQCGRLAVGGGGIYIEPSLEFADRTMTPVNAKVKHLILLADGDDCDTQEGALALAHKMVGKGMTVSVIAIGSGKDINFLKSLAAVGKGYFYLADHANQLQRLVTQDTSVMSRSAIEEGAFLPKVDPTDQVLHGIDLPSMPALYGYDLTSDRPLARTPMRTAKDDPLLAYWQYGLGTSIAFTSDAQPKWARPWLSWRDFDALWSQAIRMTLRQSSSDRIQMSVRRVGSKGQLDVAAFDPSGNPINGLTAKVSVTGPNGRAQTVAIEQTGPGRYGGTFDADQTGGYVLTAAQSIGTSSKPQVTRAGFAVAYPPEYQSIGTNTALLSDIAATTHGLALSRPIQAFRPAVHPGESVQDLWPLLVLAATLLFLFDIAVRRLAFSFADITGWIRSGAGAMIGKRGARQNAPQAATIAKLKTVRDKSRVPISTGAPPATAQRFETSTPPTSDETAAASSGDAPDQATPADKPRSAAMQTQQRLLEIKRKQRK
jgi:uncharacterized membrane protein